jgi:tRNA pseudouridine55 synthase
MADINKKTLEHLAELARKGIQLEMKPRKVIVYDAEILKIGDKKAWISFSVSSGTYIRSLTNDIGEKLKIGGYLYNLKRTKIGDFLLKSAKNRRIFLWKI